jgi:hypothetical protein
VRSSLGHCRASLGLLLALLCVSACDKTGSTDSEFDFEAPLDDEGSAPIAAVPLPEPALPPPLPAPKATCEERIAQIQHAEALPGAPEFENNRALILMRAKAEPVLFLREPRPTTELAKGLAPHQKRLLGSTAREAAYGLVRAFRGRPEDLRQLFLREGYLYITDSGAARDLGATLTLEDLFVEPRLRLERGSEQFSIRKDKGKYLYENGASAGQRAQILMFDRVWIEGVDPGPALHVELREPYERASMDQLRPMRLTAGALWAQVRYDTEWVDAVFQLEPPHMSLECEKIAPADVVRIGKARDRAYRHAAVVRQLQRAIVTQVAAGLPFDEPRSEVGQQDGELRKRWEDAYFAGADRYSFNNDKYSVFDSRGQPLTPQVCIDFVTETFERASGMHYAPRGEKPEKIRGTLDFDEILLGQRRRELALRAYARDTPQYFSLIDYPQGQIVKYERGLEFFRYLIDHEADFDTGDIVIIRGRAAWDYYAAVHSHTFFIYETDPITGVPILLAGNSGKPRILTWDAEMQRAPKRGVHHRIRPNMDWLYDQVVLREPAAEERWAAPLSVFQDG